MNKLQEQIRKILKEESLIQKLKRQIDTIGFLNTSTMVGGFKRLINLLGKDFLTDYYKIKIIGEIILTTDEEQLSFREMGENPLVLRDEDGELTQIEFVSLNFVTAYSYGGYKYSQDLDDMYINYEELPRNVLDDIYITVLHYGIDSGVLKG